MKMVAINPKNGLHLRDANDGEIQLYKAANQNNHPSFHRPVLVDSVLIDQYNGPGTNHVPSRFF